MAHQPARLRLRLRGISRGSFRPQLRALLAAMLGAAAVLAFSDAAAGQVIPLEPGKPTIVVKDLKIPPAGLRILVYGDMRFTDPENTVDTVPRVRAWLARKVAEENPDALLVTGDIPFHGSDPADWQRFRSEAASWWSQGLRVYPTVGNHEVVPDYRTGYENYFAAFPQLHGQHIYSVLLGNAYVIALNATEPVWPTGYQAEWLRAQLDNLPPQVDFVFFLIHVPMMADVQSKFIVNVPSPDFEKLRGYLEARQAGAHAKFIVVSGHLHTYEHFERNGITHVISGGGGAKPYPVFLTGEEELYHDRMAAPDFNYVLFTIQGRHAGVKMYRVADPDAASLSVQLSDSFELDAPKAPAQQNAAPGVR